MEGSSRSKNKGTNRAEPDTEERLRKLGKRCRVKTMSPAEVIGLESSALKSATTTYTQRSSESTRGAQNAIVRIDNVSQKCPSISQGALANTSKVSTGKRGVLRGILKNNAGNEQAIVDVNNPRKRVRFNLENENVPTVQRRWTHSAERVQANRMKKHIHNEYPSTAKARKKSTSSPCPPPPTRTLLLPPLPPPQRRRTVRVPPPPGPPPNMLSSSQDTGSSFVAIVNGTNSDGKEQLINNPKVRLYLEYRPAQEVTWKGEFAFSNSMDLGDFGSFQAKPARKLFRRALDFSKKLPSILETGLLPDCNLQENLFHDQTPDFHDIGLYFFPTDDVTGSKEGYVRLFDLIESNNSPLVTCIDGVELLIFTSKRLPADSQDAMVKLDTSFFLWGVFRSTKKKYVLSDLPEQAPPLGSAQDAVMENDMNIDVQDGNYLTLGEEIATSSQNVALVPHEYPPTEVESGFQFLRSAYDVNHEDVDVQGEIVRKEIGNSSLVSCRYPSTEVKLCLHMESAHNVGMAIQRVDADMGGRKLLGWKDVASSSQSGALAPYQDSLPIDVRSENYRVEFYKAFELNALTPHRWILPPVNWVKLNIDGFVNDNSGLYRASGIVRDYAGNWIHGYSFDVNFSMRLPIVFCALIRGLHVLWEKGFRRVIVETTCLKAVEYLEKEHPTGSDLDLVMAKYCRNLINRDWECMVTCIHCEGNKCASSMASNYSGFVFSESPLPHMVPIVEQDRVAAAPPALMMLMGELVNPFIPM